MSLAFVILAGIIVGGSLGSMLFRNPVHCALSLAITFSGLAGIYLQLDAEFIGFAQILVYIGAVAILIVFAILLTRSSEAESSRARSTAGWWVGIGVAVATFVAISIAIHSSALALRPVTEVPKHTIEQIGILLLDQYVLPLEVMGLLLTAAMIGAVLIAMKERPSPEGGGGASS